MTTPETITPALRMESMLTVEMIDELAGWLFPGITRANKNSAWEWMRSAGGLENVENEMIRRGYVHFKIALNANFARPWWASFAKSPLSYAKGYFSDGATKAEAILLATYKAMKETEQS